MATKPKMKIDFDFSIPLEFAPTVEILYPEALKFSAADFKSIIEKRGKEFMLLFGCSAENDPNGASYDVEIKSAGAVDLSMALSKDLVLQVKGTGTAVFSSYAHGLLLESKKVSLKFGSLSLSTSLVLFPKNGDRKVVASLSV